MRFTTSKNFLYGYMRAIDLSGRKNWPDLSGDRTKDFDALRRDWENVGRAIKRETKNIKAR